MGTIEIDGERVNARDGAALGSGQTVTDHRDRGRRNRPGRQRISKGIATMSKILVLYYSSYGHLAKMADAVAEGARSTGAKSTSAAFPRPHRSKWRRRRLRRRSQPSGARGRQRSSPKQYDGIIVGAPTRFGRMASQMASFWDRAGGVWFQGQLNGKVGGAFTSTATQHGGQETTLFSIITNLLHFGLNIVGLDYGYAGQSGVDEVKGGSPYGATTISDSDGSRLPSQAELDGARYQGRKVAELANKIAAPHREVETA
jgi:NAD(P)H dehydrogenase (quinone)